MFKKSINLWLKKNKEKLKGFIYLLYKKIESFLEKVYKKIEPFFEKEFPPFKKARNKKLYLGAAFFMIIAAIIIPIIGFYPLIQTIEPLMDIFTKNFGYAAVGGSFSILILCILAFGSYIFGRWAICCLNETKPKWAWLFIISTTLTIFLIGLVFLHMVIGAPNIKWKLLDKNNYAAEIECSDLHERLVYNHMVYCSIKPHEPNDFKIEDVAGSTTFLFYNGSGYTKELESNKIEFIAQNDLAQISLVLSVNTTEKTDWELGTTFKPKFYTEEGERQREKDFLIYFLGLLFLCLITIPQILLKLAKNLNK